MFFIIILLLRISSVSKYLSLFVLQDSNINDNISNVNIKVKSEEGKIFFYIKPLPL